MSSLSSISETLGELDGQISDIFRALSLIKEFDQEVKDMETVNDANTNRILNEKKQSMVKELNSYVNMKKQYVNNLENKRADLFEGPSEGAGEQNVLLASSMTNQQLVDHGNQMMDETDQAIERGKKIVQETIGVGTETAAALKAQTDQMSRIVNELDSIHFSLKKASKLVKEIGRQVATDRCIMALLFLIVMGVIAIIIVKLVHPNNKDIRDIPGLAPPAQTRKLLSYAN
ncbi:putative plant SNARE 11 isoform X2 [Silene latifolia]|uniref:putative plant SNARE 11 isoform X2 n=1 Tax=Silene latifolia TaxID=37657 RepID=UPI003D7743A7